MFRLSDIDLFLFDGEGGGAPAGGAAPAAEAGAGQEAGDAGVANQTQPKDYRKEYETYLSDPEIKKIHDETVGKKIEEAVKRRFKEVEPLKDKATKLDRMTQLLMEKYGVSSEDEALSKIEEEALADAAYKNNMPVDKYKDYLSNKEKAQQLDVLTQKQLEDQMLQQQASKWKQEAEDFKTVIPDFNLADAVMDDSFYKLLKAGLSVKEAYAATNLDKIMEASQKQAIDATVKDIQAKNQRPREAAASAKEGLLFGKSVSNLTKEERAQIAERARRGETIKL